MYMLHKYIDKQNLYLDTVKLIEGRNESNEKRRKQL